MRVVNATIDSSLTKANAIFPDTMLNKVAIFSGAIHAFSHAFSRLDRGLDAETTSAAIAGGSAVAAGALRRG